MADEQDRSEQPHDPSATDPPGPDATPAKHRPAKAAKKAPAKAAKKTPAKKSPAKAAKPRKTAPKKAPPKVAPPPPGGTQSPAEVESEPRPTAQPTSGTEPVAAAKLAETNGDRLSAAAANEAAAHAKHAVDTAGESLSNPLARVPGTRNPQVNIAVAVALGLALIILLRRLRASD